jgi:hypothetical protein
MGHATEYGYTEGKADFTYDDSRPHSTNAYILLTSVRSMAREYDRDRHGRIMNDTAISYYNVGENGNRQCYTAVLTRGNVRTEYKYSVDGVKSKDNVLDILTVETVDRFTQLTHYTYNLLMTINVQNYVRTPFFIRRTSGMPYRG